MKRHEALWMMVIILLTGLALIGCSGGGSSSSGDSSSGDSSGGDSSSETATVALYLTDDISDYSEVKAIINSVSVSHTGDGETCGVLSAPTLVDLAELSDVIELVAVANCPVASYNRLNLTFQKTVTIMNSAGISNTCEFTSYRNENGQPNALSCAGEFCTLDINGAVNVLVNQSNPVGLDFNLREFDVEGFGTVSCSVTMKVSPLNASEMSGLKSGGDLESVKGTVSNLNTSLSSFTLTRHDQAYTVIYNGVTQVGINDILLLAQTAGLNADVHAASIDVDTLTVSADAIYVEVEGTISGLNDIAHTFTLTYGMGQMLTLDYTLGTVDGTLIDGAVVEVKLDGYNGVNYTAHKVEVESEAEELIEDEL